MVLAQAHPTVGVLWPLRWPSHATQGTGFERHGPGPSDLSLGDAVRHLAAITQRGATGDRPRAATDASDGGVAWGHHAFVAQLEEDNLFHALFHALPTYVSRRRSIQRPTGCCTHNPCPQSFHRPTERVTLRSASQHPSDRRSTPHACS